MNPDSNPHTEQSQEPGQKPILVAVDGTNLLHRAHYAYSRTDRRDAHGKPAWALWGMAKMLERAMDEITNKYRRPSGLIVCLDGPKNLCQRRAADSQYKATRRETDPALAEQLENVQDWLENCGITVARYDGWEADDGCASAAKTAKENGWRCVIVTSDRDLLACCDVHTRVLRPVNGGGWELLGVREIAAKYNLPDLAGVYATYSALRGDPSDNLDGVAGIGEKTAGVMLKALTHEGYSIEDALSGNQKAIDCLKPRAWKLLKEGEANYQRNRKLMDGNTRLDVNLEDAKRAVDASEIAGTCAEWGLEDAEEHLSRAVPRLAVITTGGDF